MKILYVLLLSIGLLFAQYGNNYIETATSNSSFETATGTPDDDTTDDFSGWTEVSIGSGILDQTATAYSGSYGVAVIQGSSPYTQIKSSIMALSNAVTYRLDFYTYGTGSLAGNYALYNESEANYIISYGSTGHTAASWGRITNTFVSPGNVNATARFYAPDPQGTKIRFDLVALRTKRDTLTVATTGNDSDADTVLTHVEAFETRGSHSGGVFLSLTGTYSESITSDSSFSEWSARGGNVTITAVDFNSVTLSNLDARIAKNIGTPTNYSNVTVYFDSTLTTQATGLSFTGVTGKRAVVNWTRGDGDSVLVVMRKGADPTDPTDNTNYTANSVFKSGSDIGSGSYAVYRGTGTSVTVTGLSETTRYYVNIFEFDHALDQWKYLGTPLAGNEQTHNSGYRQFKRFKR